MPTAGELTTHTFPHDGGRSVTLYTPTEPAEVVVFAADGGWHATRLVEALEAADAPSTMVVGVHGRDDDDGRFAECLPGVDDGRFAAYEQLFVHDVADWLRGEHDVTVTRERTAVWGASIGGEYALAMGMRHPGEFGAVFSASPGGGYQPPETLPEDLPVLYLVAGEDEPWFAENAERWLHAFEAAERDVVMEVRPGDHGGTFWYEELPLMVRWAFAR